MKQDCNIWIGFFMWLLSSCGSGTSQPAGYEKPPQNVMAAQVEPYRYQPRFSAYGITEQAKTFRLSFKISGMLRVITVEEGGTFRQGQLLAALDRTEIQAQANQAKLNYEKKQRDYARMQNLYKAEVATKEQLENARTQSLTAKNEWEIAGFNLKHSRIVAPFPGKVVTRMAGPGELTGPGNPVLEVISTADALQFSTFLADKEVIAVDMGDTVTLAFDVYPDKTFPSVITAISPLPHPQHGAYETIIRPIGRNHPLRPGFVGKVTIKKGASQNCFAIPPAALLDIQGSKGVVFIVRDGIALRKEVEMLELTQDRALIRAGLTKEGIVVTHGAGYLSDGDSIKIVKP